MSKKEYIEKERALQLLEENASDDEVFFVARAIEAEPSADVKPVVRGEWIFGVSDNIAWMKCSNCLKSQRATGVFAYCPNCGADMRGETKDER